MSAQTTLTGNLVADPELTFGGKGTAVARFRVATSRRIMKNNEWTASETTFWRCKAFGKLAENIAESLTKGDAVIVVGRVLIEQYETADGQKRETTQVITEHAGPSLNRKPITAGKPATTDPWEQPAKQTADMPF
jgi:single-strand DNA-binding protein